MAPRRGPGADLARHLAAAGLFALALAAPHLARASVAELSLAVLAGTAQPDVDLSDYAWDVRPHAAWGARALVGHGRLSAGLRLWRTESRQSFDLPGGMVAAATHSTSVECVGRARLASLAGVGLHAAASVGRLHLGYSPDHVSVPASGGGAPIEVRLAPQDEWIAGGGLAVERPLGSDWSLGLELDHRLYALDTAHREGSVVVQQRTTFGEWGARLAFARLLLRR